MLSAARLAWLQLRRQKVRFAVALAGVAFAVVLMLMQFGFRDALFRSAVTLHRRLLADIVLVHPNYNVLAFPTAFPRRRVAQALAYPGVASVASVYFAQGQWQNPATGRTRSIFVVGVDPERPTLDDPAVSALLPLLRRPDVVLFDEYSRPEFGPVPGRLRADGSVQGELNGRRVTVRGLFRQGTSFGIDGTIVTSDLNFQRIFARRAASPVGLGLVRVEPGVDPETVRGALEAGLPRDVRVLTRDAFMVREVNYWARATPIGFVFSFGVVMGLVVGMIVVYQILFADIADHLAEYATLKAMGFTNRYLSTVVLVEATFLAVLGLIPAVLIAMRLYRLTQATTMLPMALEAGRLMQVLGLTMLMCWASGLIAMRKLRAADPADVF